MDFLTCPAFPPPGIRTTRPNCGWKRRKGRPSKATCRQPRKARRERSKGRREDMEMEKKFQTYLTVLGRTSGGSTISLVCWMGVKHCIDVIGILASLNLFYDRLHVAWIEVTTYDSSTGLKTHFQPKTIWCCLWLPNGSLHTRLNMPKFDESIGIHLSSNPFILLCCQWAANAKKLQGETWPLTASSAKCLLIC